jgi:hypothetical protein
MQFIKDKYTDYLKPYKREKVDLKIKHHILFWIIILVGSTGLAIYYSYQENCAESVVYKNPDSSCQQLSSYSNFAINQLNQIGQTVKYGTLGTIIIDENTNCVELITGACFGVFQTTSTTYNQEVYISLPSYNFSLINQFLNYGNYGSFKLITEELVRKSKFDIPKILLDKWPVALLNETVNSIHSTCESLAGELWSTCQGYKISLQPMVCKVCSKLDTITIIFLMILGFIQVMSFGSMISKWIPHNESVKNDDIDSLLINNTDQN